MKNSTVYIVDDHVLFREGIKFLLSKLLGIQNIYEAGTGEELLQKIKENVPDIILMDIEMPGMGGIDATKAVLNLYPETKIIALSMYSEECFYKDMLNAGAKGFLLKNSDFEIVKTAMHEVYSGRNYFSPEILESILNGGSKTASKSKKSDLSERETEVLYNICKGLSNQEIAEKMFISKRTVDKHRENLLLKTGSKNTAELVVHAIKNEYFLLK